MAVSNDTILYLVMSSIIVLLALVCSGTLGPYSLASDLLIIVAMACLVMLAFVDHIIFTFVTSVFGITFEPAKDYKINKHQDSVTKYVNGIYYATGYITCNLFSYVFKAESIQPGEEERMMEGPDIWERAVMSIPFPFKFNVLSCARDVQKVRDDLEGKRSYQEFQMARALESRSVNTTIITDIQRKINVIQAQIDKLSQDEQPIATLIYIETTAVGVTEAAAVEALSSQINQLGLAFGSMDVQTTRIVGRELYKLFTYNFALPLTYAEVASEFEVEE